MRGMIKDLKSVMHKADLVGNTRFVLMFDLFFTYLEPNKVKRRKVLGRIFRLQPKLSDREWVRLIKISHKKALNIAKLNYKKLQK